MRIPALAGLSLVVGFSISAALPPAWGEGVPMASAPLPPPLPAPTKSLRPGKRAPLPAARRPPAVPLPREKPLLASAGPAVPAVPLPQEKPLFRLAAKPRQARKNARSYRERPFPAGSFAPARAWFGPLRPYPPSLPPPYPYRAPPYGPGRPFFAGPPYPYPPFVPPYAR